jgi:hypothetical protein
MSGYIQSNQVLHLPALAAYTINAADTGKIMILPQTVGVDLVYTLPVASAGLHYRFINGAALALNGHFNIAEQGGANMYGCVISGPIGGVALKAITGDTSMQFQTALSVLGDFIDFTCDGTNWYVDGRSQVAGGII